MAVAFAGMIISLVTGIPMLEWGLSNWARLTDPSSPDPLGVLWDLWLHMRWPLVGICIFATATLWAAATGMRLVSKAPEEGVPPRIEP
jgi:hypothetical protein